MVVILANIKDVAKKAGVAISTASYALNGRTDKVSKDTADKILEIAKEMNYSPNAFARGLVKKKSNTIGIFLLNIDKSHPYVMEVLLEIMNISREKNYDILLFSNKSPGDIPYIDKAKKRGVDGLIIFGLENDDPYIQNIKNTDLPTVIIDKELEGEKITYVESQNRKSAFNAVNYLIKKGHSKIAFIGGRTTAEVNNKRYSGYIDALKENNIEINQDLIINCNFKREEAYNKTLKILEKEVDSFFVVTDLMALGVIDALREKNINIPEEIAVIGFDDIDLASNSFPKLTTMAQDKKRIGNLAVKKLFEIMEKAKNVEPESIKCKLIIRETA